MDNIGQYWVDCATPEAKFNAISNIYGVVTIGQAMIFCQTRKTASWLVEKMKAEGHAVALLSGELSVEDRISVGRLVIFHNRYIHTLLCIKLPEYPIVISHLIVHQYLGTRSVQGRLRKSVNNNKRDGPRD